MINVVSPVDDDTVALLTQAAAYKLINDQGGQRLNIATNANAALEEANRLKEIPIEGLIDRTIVFTSFPSTQEAVQAYHKGADKYVTRDHDPKRLSEEL